MSTSDSLQVTLGGLEVGVLIATFVYALSCFQCFLYWRSNFNDRLGVRILVWVVLTFETAHTVCFWIYLFTITVKYYGDPGQLEQRHWSIAMSVVFHGLIGGCVQSYYSYRVWMVSNKRHILIPCLCLAGCFIYICGSVGIAVVFYLVGPVTFEAHWVLFPTINIVIDLSVDVVNSAMLCYLLYRLRTGIKSTDRVVTGLIEWSVETGLITALAALGMLIACIVTPNTAVYLSITSFYAKFFSNSLLASLNGRGPFSPFRIYNPPTMVTIGGPTSDVAFGVNITQVTETSSTPLEFSRSSVHQLSRVGANDSHVKSRTSAQTFQLSSISEFRESDRSSQNNSFGEDDKLKSDPIAMA